LIKEHILKQANYPTKMVCFGVSLLLLLATLGLASCQSAGSEAPDEVAQVEPVLVETATAVSPTEVPTSEPTLEPVPVDNCLDCHTNKDLLIQTADPEEEVISENEGEG
jgi:hypothetical protein